MTRHVYRVLCLAAILSSWLSAADDHSRFAVTNSRSEYVHWIDLYDAKNGRIDPSDPNAAPYSPATTCGRCHDYATISRGHHFNAIQKNVPAGRPGEPWIWVDDRTGTQLPLSYRSWEGVYDPEDLGISPRDFVLKFGRHLPGGGPGKPPKPESSQESTETPGDAEAPPEAAEDAAGEESEGRWKLSGWLNVDCMFCHSDSHTYSPEVWRDQIDNENFAWAPTAASGLGFVEGKVSGLPDDFDPAAAEPNSRQQLPKTTYAPLRVNLEKKVFFDIVRQPANSACYYCHTTRMAIDDAAPDWMHDEDVHIRAGMTCSDCHRNGIDHETVRGYEGEEHPSGLSVETLSCRGCHLGEVGSGGRFGAPRPLHKGLPPLHLERLSCTACHSGPQPGPQAQQIQTAMAHGLGLPSHDYTSAMAPGIVAPVLIQDGGTLYPHRMTWPAFWGKLKDGTITPLNPEAAYEALRRVLRVRRGETLMQTLSEVKLSSDDKKTLLGEARTDVDEAEWSVEEKAEVEQFKKTKTLEAWQEKLAESLEALKETTAAEGADPVYVGGGRAYRLGADGKPEEFENAAAQPYAWKLAHDVRPAGWSSGAGSCYECHSAGTPIFEGKVTAIAAVPDDEPITQSMYELAGYDKQKLDAWSQSFQGRPMFKYAGFAAMGVLGLILLAYLVQGINGLSARLRRT